MIGKGRRERPGQGREPRQRGAVNRQEWWRGLDLNQRPLGYEPNELPDCSTPLAEHDTSYCLVTGKPAPGALRPGPGLACSA